MTNSDFHKLLANIIKDDGLNSSENFILIHTDPLNLQNETTMMLYKKCYKCLEQIQLLHSAYLMDKTGE